MPVKPSLQAAAPAALDDERMLEVLMNTWKRFKAEFRTSARGNHWRHLEDGRRLTVYRNGKRWCWVINDGDAVEFSPKDYATADLAMDDLWHRLGYAE